MNKYDYDSLTLKEIRALPRHVQEELKAYINLRLGSLRAKQAVIEKKEKG